MHIDDLHKLKRVEAPPFLFTRIQQKIEQAQATRLPGKVIWAVGFSLVLVLMVNIGTIRKVTHKTNNLEHFAQSMDLTTDNTLYK
jgi:hypothetical protein